MSKFKSFFSALIEQFIVYRKASGSWNAVYESNIRYFDRFCADNFPAETDLTQQMVDTWCAKRSTEMNRSNYRRTDVIRIFVDYLRRRELTSALPPPKLKQEPRTYIPHAFQEEELQRFFQACDQIKTVPGKASALRKMTVPVFFRLLYSTGMRTTEARLLRRDNVDLVQGVIDVQKSKGYDQHYVAMHSTMTGLMIRYDRAINELQPSREFFFQSIRGGHYSNTWVVKNFRTLWKQLNGTAASPVAYDLRHHYATTNINQWLDDGFSFSDKLQYLSKSMGHRTILTTSEYYSLVPRLANTLREKTEAGFNAIVPEVI
jgi:integrase